MVESQRFCWGDMFSEEKAASEQNLIELRTFLIPIARRDDGEQGKAYFTDKRFLLKGERDYKIHGTREKIKFKLVVKSGKFKAESPHFYIVRAPNFQTDRNFCVEIEYEGMGSQ